MKILIVALISLTLLGSCAHRSCTSCQEKKSGCADCSGGDKKSSSAGCKDCEQAEAAKK